MQQFYAGLKERQFKIEQAGRRKNWILAVAKQASAGNTITAAYFASASAFRSLPANGIIKPCNDSRNTWSTRGSSSAWRLKRPTLSSRPSSNSRPSLTAILPSDGQHSFAPWGSRFQKTPREKTTPIHELEERQKRPPTEAAFRHVAGGSMSGARGVSSVTLGSPTCKFRSAASSNRAAEI